MRKREPSKEDRALAAHVTTSIKDISRDKFIKNQEIREKTKKAKT